MLIIDKIVGHIVPARFVMFCLVGLSGVAVHFVSLWATHRLMAIDFAVSQSVAISSRIMIVAGEGFGSSQAFLFSLAFAQSE